MKIYIVLPFFYVGGIERWAVNLYDFLKNERYDVSLLILGNVEADPNVYSGSKFLKIDKISLFNLTKQIFSQRNNNSNILYITALTKLNLYLSLLCNIVKVNVITSVHLSLERKEFEGYIKYKLKRFIHYIIICKSNYILCVSNGIREYLINLAPKNIHKIKLIYNPCYYEKEIDLESIKNQNTIKIVAAGRLHYQKGFDILIDAYQSIEKDHLIDAELNIYGAGELEDYLNSLIFVENSKNINLRGVSKNLRSELINADIFVMSSRYEGFGNVLAEALACGCLCIAFNVPHGPSEILKNGEFGYLINEISVSKLSEALMASILEVRGNKPSGNYINKMGIEDHLYQFTVESFGEQVIKLIKHLEKGELMDSKPL